LKKILDKVIDAMQYTFLEKRCMLDSVVLANEVLEKEKRRKECMNINMDFEKAYDTVN